MSSADPNYLNTLINKLGTSISALPCSKVSISVEQDRVTITGAFISMPRAWDDMYNLVARTPTVCQPIFGSCVIGIGEDIPEDPILEISRFVDCRFIPLTGFIPMSSYLVRPFFDNNVCAVCKYRIIRCSTAPRIDSCKKLHMTTIHGVNYEPGSIIGVKGGKLILKEKVNAG